MSRYNAPKYKAAQKHLDDARRSIEQAEKELERLLEANGGRGTAHDLISLDIALVRHARDSLPRLN